MRLMNRNLNFILLATICAIILCVDSQASIIEHQVGPYIISFDLTNSSVQLNETSAYWNESMYMGGLFIVLKDRPTYEMADIMITHNPHGSKVVYDTTGFEKALGEGGFVNIKSYSRTIDGNPNGQVISADSPYGWTYYSAGYLLDKDTLIEVHSWLPMDGGTGDILNTVHVGDLNKV